MINVGINQGSAVLRAPYGLFQRSEYARDLMVAAMEEVLELSALEGTGLERADIDAWLATLAGLNPEGKTSMLQDVEAGRRTEVDLFAGTVLEIARTHQVPVPVNETLYRIIRALESV
jgi:2-dehydropantoate 2-reductase